MIYRQFCYTILLLMSILTLSQSTKKLDVSVVDRCPTDLTSWEKASRDLNCEDRYQCTSNQHRTALVEFCYDEPTTFVLGGHCWILQNSNHVGTYNCSGFTDGCPNIDYRSNELYKYQRCLQLDKLKGCFRADKACLDQREETTVTPSVTDDDAHKMIIPSVTFGIYISLLVAALIALFVLRKRGSVIEGKGQQVNETHTESYVVPHECSEDSIDGKREDALKENVSADVSITERPDVPAISPTEVTTYMNKKYDPQQSDDKEAGNENESIHLHVLKVSEKMLSYMNKSNKEMKYFNCVGAIGEDVVRLRVYLTSKIKMIKPGTSFKFVNVSKRGEKEYWVTSQSNVLYTSLVETNITADNVLLPEEMPPEGEVKMIKDALKSSDKATVSGKVVKVSPLKYRQCGTLAVKALLLKDKDKTAKVCLFGKNAETPYSKGEMIKVTAVYPKQYFDTLQLTTSPTSTCEFINDEPSIQIDEDDGKEFSADVDFMEEQDDIPIPITLTDFSEIDVYQCCSNGACRQKKMVQNECPVCKRTDSNQKSCRVNFLYTAKDKKDQKIVLFKSTLELILKTELDLDSTKEEITQKIIEFLPITTKACISEGNTLYNIQ